MRKPTDEAVTVIVLDGEQTLTDLHAFATNGYEDADLIDVLSM
jgi:hypothetical protein